jgi:hypothetical protein
MKATPYTRSCCKTIRQFYDDFDALPRAVKELLWDGSFQPTMDDLKAAWEIAAADKSLADLIKEINCMKPSKEELKARADAERERKKREKSEARWAKRRPYYETRPIYGQAKLNPKHARLVGLVISEQEAAKMLANRKENADVNLVPMYVCPIIGYERVKMVDTNTIPPEKPEPPQSIIKMMHNAGGRKTS